MTPVSQATGTPENDSHAPRPFSAEKEMLRERRRFIVVFYWLIGSVIAMIVIMVVVMLSISFTSIETVQKALLVRLIQISFGMVLGSACVFLGVVVSWLGITASYSLGAEREKARLTLQSTSPAIALIVGGIILIWASLYKEIQYTETVHEPGISIQPKSPPPAS